MITLNSHSIPRPICYSIQGVTTGVGLYQETIMKKYFFLTFVMVGLVTGMWYEQAEADVSTPWVGHFYNNSLMQGEPVLSRSDSWLRFYWGNGSPSKDINRDYFSARWSKQVTFDKPVTVVWSMVGDDGYRLFIDGKLIIDRMSGIPMQKAHASVDLDAGRHIFYIEYYEHVGNATADFQYYVGPRIKR